jgi:eukaryotic-like serine/threonine-protein kinase
VVPKTLREAGARALITQGSCCAISWYRACNVRGVTLTASVAPRLAVLEKYELIELLGEGGMGAIWRARHVLLDAPVAIKLLRPDQRSAELSERLLREARAAARLGHPAIVRVTDVGMAEDGSPFLVMELLHGQSLARLVEREGPLRPERALQMLLPIAEALAVAHRKGVMHRDLKPDNVFLALESYGVQPKLLDFGIARFREDGRRRRLTQSGMVMGSPDYMSPEQVSGDEALDHRTDIWSFCVMLYELVTGRAPFRAASYEAQLRAIVGRPLLRGTIGDAELWAILERGLAKDKNRRFQTMNDLGRALASYLIGRGIQQDICGTQLETRWLVPSAPVRMKPVPSASAGQQRGFFARLLPASW